MITQLSMTSMFHRQLPVYVFNTRSMTLHDTIYNVWCIVGTIKTSSGFKVKHAFMALRVTLSWIITSMENNRYHQIKESWESWSFKQHGGTRTCLFTNTRKWPVLRLDIHLKERRHKQAKDKNGATVINWFSSAEEKASLLFSIHSAA